MTTRTDRQLIACYRSAIAAAPNDATLRAICEDMIGNDSLCDDDNPRAQLVAYLDEWSIELDRMED